jgi:hypothetical protein
MREMTDQEAEYLDELWTRTTPEIDMTRPGYFARKALVLGDVAPAGLVVPTPLSAA